MLLQKVSCHLKPHRVSDFTSLAHRSSREPGYMHRTLDFTQHQREFGVLRDGGGVCHGEVSDPPKTSLWAWYLSGSPPQPPRLFCQVAQPSFVLQLSVQWQRLPHTHILLLSKRPLTNNLPAMHKKNNIFNDSVNTCCLWCLQIETDAPCSPLWIDRY